MAGHVVQAPLGEQHLEGISRHFKTFLLCLTWLRVYGATDLRAYGADRPV